ncbi:hypothetical protein VNO77_02856 [Canavalia gladiata]|uniref:Uncharacterized protein n=1 Tax=Canavalia gladiata TaxID=3824 RepID=A0AAN9MUI0_CANGL
MPKTYAKPRTHLVGRNLELRDEVLLCGNARTRDELLGITYRRSPSAFSSHVQAGSCPMSHARILISVRYTSRPSQLVFNIPADPINITRARSQAVNLPRTLPASDSIRSGHEHSSTSLGPDNEKGKRHFPNATLRPCMNQ